MTQILVQSTIKYICENFTVLANNRNDPITVANTVQIGDAIIRIDPSPRDFKSNRVYWFRDKAFYVTKFVAKDDTEVHIEPAKYTLVEGDIAYPDSHTTINDWSVLDDTREEAPYLIIENAFRANTRREGSLIPTWTLTIQPHVAWRHQDIALVKMTELIDEILQTLQTKLLYPALPALKFVGLFMEVEPFVRQHPNTPPDVPGYPIYVGQRVLLVIEDYLSTYESFSSDSFFDQFN